MTATRKITPKWSDDQLRRMAPAEHVHQSVIADDRGLTHSHDGGAVAHSHPTYEYRS